MATTVAKKAILKAKLEGVITELLVTTNAENVYVDETTTLADKLADILTSSEVDTKISEAISALIADAPETYDTLKEIADYIEAHQDVVDSLNAAIGDKLDKTVYEAFLATLGTLAYKSTVSESDLDSALAEKVNTAAAGNHSHANKDVLDKITEEVYDAWTAKATIYYSATEPTSMAEGDLWVQLVDETTD